MEEFLALLKDINKTENLINSSTYQGKTYLTNGTAEDYDPKVAKAVELACEHLITPNGRNSIINIKILRDNGFNVYAGERDSFGWLSGCIETRKGIIVYG